MSALPRPQMRGLLKSHLKKHFAIGMVVALTAASCVKFFVYDWRKAKYAEFYKNYDIQKDFERMRDLGVFHSVRPLGEESEE